MFDKWRKYSYAAQKSQWLFIRWIFIWIVVFFLLYTLITVFFFSMRVLENETMLPGFHRGDRLILSSFGFNRLILQKPWTDRSSPFRRGHVVLVDTALKEKQNIFIVFLDTLVRFFTAQQMSVTDPEEHFFIKRVIALPGDEISMTQFVLRVKPQDETYSYTEFELSDRPYDITIPQVPALWDVSLPFSGNMEPLVLGDDECFVLSDDRSNTNDSRTWGPISTTLITGRVLFRYWPLNRFGRP
ncbi:MAG: signal peptidase I [Spirochaetaceae bacterium]|jgi:signal peptidase I|nr:signal peptidase I [Spirochaetaceae bacterium]